MAPEEAPTSSEEATEDGSAGEAGDAGPGADMGEVATDEEGEATEDESGGGSPRGASEQRVDRGILGALALYSGQSVTPKLYREWDHILCTDPDMQARDIPQPKVAGVGRGRKKPAESPNSLTWQETVLPYAGTTRRAFMLAREPERRGPKPSLLRVLKLTHRSLGNNVITRHVRALGQLGAMSPADLLCKDVIWDGNPNIPCQVLFDVDDVKVWWSMERVPGLNVGLGNHGPQGRRPVLKTSRTWKGSEPPGRKQRRAVTDVALENLGSRRLLKFWPGQGVFTVEGCIWQNQILRWCDVFPPVNNAYAPPPLMALVAHPGSALLSGARPGRGAGAATNTCPGSNVSEGTGSQGTEDGEGGGPSGRGQKRGRASVEAAGEPLGLETAALENDFQARGRGVPNPASGAPRPSNTGPTWPSSWGALHALAGAPHAPCSDGLAPGSKAPLGGVDASALARACAAAARELGAAGQALDNAAGQILGDSLEAREAGLKRLKDTLKASPGGLEEAGDALQARAAALDTPLKSVIEVRRCLRAASQLAAAAGQRLGAWSRQS